MVLAGTYPLTGGPVWGRGTWEHEETHRKASRLTADNLCFGMDCLYPIRSIPVGSVRATGTGSTRSQAPREEHCSPNRAPRWPMATELDDNPGGLSSCSPEQSQFPWGGEAPTTWVVG